MDHQQTESASAGRDQPAAPTLTPPSGRRRRLVLGAAVLAALIVAGVWYVRRPPPQPELPAVNLTGVDPEVAAAIEKAQSEVRQGPRSAKAWGRLGMVLSVHGFHAESLSAFAEAERLDPQEPRWPYYQGDTLQLFDFERANLKLRRAVELSNQPMVRVQLARLLLAQGQFDEAESLLHQAAQQEPDDGRVQLGLGQLERARNRLTESFDHLQRAAAWPGTRKAAHGLLAEVHAQLGNEKKAEEERRIVAGLPDDADAPDPYPDEAEAFKVGQNARLARATALRNARRHKESLALLHQTAERYPNSDAVWLALARGYLVVRQLDAAEYHVRKAISVRPDNFEAHMVLGFALYHQRAQRREALGEAADAFREAIRLSPAMAEPYYGLGWCSRDQGNWSDAVASFRTALSYRPDYAEAHGSLGQLLTEIGRQSAAAGALQALVGCPAATDVALAIRIEALTHLRHAVQLNPDDPLAQKALDGLRAEFPVPGG